MAYLRAHLIQTLVGVAVVAFSVGALTFSVLYAGGSDQKEPDEVSAAAPSQLEQERASLGAAVELFAEYCDSKTNTVDGVPVECQTLHDWRDESGDTPVAEYPGVVPQNFVLEAKTTLEQLHNPTEGSGITQPGERVKPGTANCASGYHVVGNDESEGCFPD